MSFNDPYDDFEKNMRAGRKGRVYDYRGLPGDVAGLTKAVARSAAEVAGYVGRVLAGPFRFPKGPAIEKMIQKERAKQDRALLDKDDPFYRPGP